jgi:ribosomal protein S18 acetylase RimI-like enzyme
MIVQTKNNRQVILRTINPGDFDLLFDYLQRLSPDTLQRFGPHKFDKQSILELFEHSDKHLGFVAQEAETFEITAYSIIRIGYLEHDSFRLQKYGLTLDHNTDCTFAPSVADQWQSLGIGNSLFNFMLSDLRAKGLQRIILWGGVQCNNTKAVNFYIRNGFRILGEFEYYGRNYDMISEIG